MVGRGMAGRSKTKEKSQSKAESMEGRTGSKIRKDCGGQEASLKPIEVCRVSALERIIKLIEDRLGDDGFLQFFSHEIIMDEVDDLKTAKRKLNAKIYCSDKL